MQLCDFLKQHVVTPAAHSAGAEEDEEEESHFSEGQLVPVSSQSVSDDSEISEEIIEGEEILIGDSYWNGLQY